MSDKDTVTEQGKGDGSAQKRLDNTTKIVSIVSVSVGLMLSVAGYFGNRKLQELQTSIAQLNVAKGNIDVAKGQLDISKGAMEVSEKQYLLAARLAVSFSTPLAKSFALDVSQCGADQACLGQRISYPTTELGNEFTIAVPRWRERKGLMTGDKCSREGLHARQVVLLGVRNIGYADAQNVTIRFIRKASPHPSPLQPWFEPSANGEAIAYYDLPPTSRGWISETVSIDVVRGASSPEKDRVEEQLVMASVASARELYGTILVPVEITWTDALTGKAGSMPVMQGQQPRLRKYLGNHLGGSEIGNLGDSC